jgi:hypothetical protein
MAPRGTLTITSRSLVNGIGITNGNGIIKGSGINHSTKT